MDRIATKTAIVERAQRAHTTWPQYQGHWEGPEWKLGRITRTIRTKMGVAFERGDLVIAKIDPEEIQRAEADAREWGSPSDAYVTAYSERNEVDTRIRARHIVWLEN